MRGHRLGGGGLFCFCKTMAGNCAAGWARGGGCGSESKLDGCPPATDQALVRCSSDRSLGAGVHREGERPRIGLRNFPGSSQPWALEPYGSLDHYLGRGLYPGVCGGAGQGLQM
jgi:hypothetical protein